MLRMLGWIFNHKRLYKVRVESGSTSRVLGTSPILLREIVAKYDMSGVHSSPIPLPAGRKVYMNENWDGDEDLRNLYQQITGSLNYAAQLRPELMFSVSQLSRVMSCPTPENLNLARQVIKYIIGSLDLKITYRPDDPDDANSEANNELMMFTDSD